MVMILYYWIPKQPYDVDTTISLNLQLKKPRHSSVYLYKAKNYETRNK